MPTFPAAFWNLAGEGAIFLRKNRINPAVFRMFSISRSQFPIGRDFFVFCSCWQNGNCTHFHSFPHYANVSPCVPAGKTVQWTIFRAQVHCTVLPAGTQGKTVQWTIFRAQVPPRPDWPEKGTVPSPSGLAHASRKCLHSPRGDRSLIVHHTEKSERILFVDAFGFVFL